MFIGPESFTPVQLQALPPRALVPSNDEQFHQEVPTLAPGRPLKANLSVFALKDAVGRLDRIITEYQSLPEEHRSAVDAVALRSVDKLVPLHRAMSDYVNSCQTVLRSPIHYPVWTVNAVPPALFPLACMILATDAALDIIDRNTHLVTPNSRGWLTQYRNLLRRGMNRTADAVFQQRALAAKAAKASQASPDAGA